MARKQPHTRRTETPRRKSRKRDADWNAVLIPQVSSLIVLSDRAATTLVYAGPERRSNKERRRHRDLERWRPRRAAEQRRQQVKRVR